MLGLILFALFSTVAVGAAAVLADSFIRGRDAFARLRREMAEAESVDRIRIVIEDSAENETISACRLRPINRAGRRPRAAARMQMPLPAAA